MARITLHKGQALLPLRYLRWSDQNGLKMIVPRRCLRFSLVLFPFVFVSRI